MDEKQHETKRDVKHGIKQKSNQKSFFETLHNALGADMSHGRDRIVAGLNEQHPSFTIPLPSNNNNNVQHKESWFGSFGNYGGRKSTDGFIPKASFNMQN